MATHFSESGIISWMLLKTILKFCITNKFLNLKTYSLKSLRQKCDLSAFKCILDLTSKYAGADWTEQPQILSNSSKSYSLSIFSNCSKNVQNDYQITLKWLFFLKKIAKNSPPGPHTCYQVQNVKNVQIVI